MIVLFIILFIPSHFEMIRCSCSHQNSEPELRGPKKEPELELVCTMENCFSMSQTVRSRLVWHHQHCQSHLMPANRSTLGYG